MTNLVATQATDMTDWQGEFADSASSIVGTHTATLCVASTSSHRYDFGGESFTYGGANHPTGGTVHDFTIKSLPDNLTRVTMSGFDALATDMTAFFFAGDWDGLENFLFSGNDTLTGGVDDDHLLGFGGNDVFDMTLGGFDVVEGSDGNDTFDYGATLAHGITGDPEADSINGGDGIDTLIISGLNYHIQFDDNLIQDVEIVKLTAGNDYSIDFSGDSAVSANGLTIDASALGSDNRASVSLDFFSTKGFTALGGAGDDTFEGGAAKDVFTGNDGHDFLIGEFGKDNLSGGAGADRIDGGAGADKLNGGTGADTFAYSFSASQSTGLKHDTIRGFDAAEDLIALTSAVDDIDAAVTAGSLSTATFNANMSAALAGHLLEHHAILFTPNAGDFAGDTFLVIDVNGHAGYQANKDIVIRLDHATHLGQLDAGNFIGNT